MFYNIEHNCSHLMDCTGVCLKRSVYLDQCSACMVIEWSSDHYVSLIGLHDKICSIQVGSQYWCNNTGMVRLAGLEGNVQNTESRTVHTIVDEEWAHLHRQIGGGGGGKPSRLRYNVFVTTSSVLRRLVKGKCPRPRLLCLAKAYKASNKDG